MGPIRVEALLSVFDRICADRQRAIGSDGVTRTMYALLEARNVRKGAQLPFRSAPASGREGATCETHASV